VLVVYDPSAVSYEDLLAVFWENHDPTQGFRQGNDVGTQYRSAIYYTDDEQKAAAERSRDTYGKRLADAGYGAITTEIAAAGPFYYAEDYHQQYLYKVPNGYCPCTRPVCRVPSVYSPTIRRSKPRRRYQLAQRPGLPQRAWVAFSGCGR